MLNLSLLVQDSNLHDVPEELGALLEEVKQWQKKQEYVSQPRSHSFLQLILSANSANQMRSNRCRQDQRAIICAGGGTGNASAFNDTGASL